MSSHPCCQYNTFLFKNDIFLTFNILTQLATKNSCFAYLKVSLTVNKISVKVDICYNLSALFQNV